jgi:hypothetical protein
VYDPSVIEILNPANIIRSAARAFLGSVWYPQEGTRPPPAILTPRVREAAKRLRKGYDFRHSTRFPASATRPEIAGNER